VSKSKIRISCDYLWRGSSQPDRQTDRIIGTLEFESHRT